MSLTRQRERRRWIRFPHGDALGNPTGFHLTGGEVHDLVGADELLPDMEADTLIADKAYDADNVSSSH